MPGDKVLGLPRYLPYLNWKWCPVYDPLHGPHHPSELFAIYDGGDSRMPAGFDRFGRLKGLDPTDTLAEYLDSKGIKKFAGVESRRHLRAAVHRLPHGIVTRHPGNAFRPQEFAAIHPPRRRRSDVPASRRARFNNSAEGIGTRMRLSGTYNTLGTSVAGQMRGLDIKASLRGTAAKVGVAEGPKMVEPKDGPLLIIKWPDKECVNVGEIVTFYLKYTNSGGSADHERGCAGQPGGPLRVRQGEHQGRPRRDLHDRSQRGRLDFAALAIQRRTAPREHGLITFEVRVR